MKFIICSLLAAAPGLANAQKSNTESRHGIIGVAKSGAFLRDNDRYCMINTKSISSRSIVFISGIKKCEYGTAKAYFQVRYQGDFYAMDTADVFATGHAYDSLSNMNDEDRNEVLSKALFSDSIHQEIVNKELQAELSTAKKYGLIIQDWGLFDMSEYTDGTGISFDIYNPSAKTIKYITFNVVAYNPVKDRVYSSKFKSYTVSLKGVGPIKTSEGGKYSWDYVWFSDLPETAKITSIQLLYTDGSSKTITEVNKTILSRRAREALTADE